MEKELKKGPILATVLVVLAAVCFLFFRSGLKDEKGIHTVTFFGPDDSVLLVTQVEHGGAAVSPVNPIMPQGYVFSCWDREFSNVTKDISIHAVCKQVGEDKNVLALSGGHAYQGEEVVLPLQLCGDVCLCGFNILITYDKDMVEFVEFRAQDGAVDANCIKEDGAIYLNYVSKENTTGEVDLAELVFISNGQHGKTDIDIEVIEMIAYDAEYNFYEPEYTVVPGVVTVSAP